MTDQSSKVGILLIGYCKDKDLIKGIIDTINEQYSHLLEFVNEGKEKLMIDISGMNPTQTNIEEEVEFIVATAIKVKKFERQRNRAIKKAGYEARKKAGLLTRKDIN